MFVRITNTPRAYAWGSTTAIAELLGTAASGAPQAELWLGAHSGSPSRILDPSQTGGAADLEAWIAADPVTTLGRFAATGRLPFLFKILAASLPLSLQAHPTNEQARIGFDRENALGIALDAPHRNYKDAFAKPELIYALSSTFNALCGFRPLAEVRALVGALIDAANALEDPQPQPLEDLLASLGPDVAGVADAGVAGVAASEGRAGSADAGDGLAVGEGRAGSADAGAVVVSVLDASSGSENAALTKTFQWLIGNGAGVPTLVALVTRLAASGVSGFSAEMGTVASLASEYPGDPGIVISLLLNRVTLVAGEALYLPAGNIHAYLDGLGVELMAASDNVLRGGLTPKYVDVAELVSVLDFTPVPVPYLQPSSSFAGVSVYRPDVADFVLVRVDGTALAAGYELTGPAIAICTADSVQIAGTSGSIALQRGESAYITPSEGALRFTGAGTMFLATTGA